LQRPSSGQTLLRHNVTGTQQVSSNSVDAFNCSHVFVYDLVPTIHQILLSSPLPSPIPKIRFIRSCSSALAPATLERLEKAFGTPVLEAYAMTEASHQMCSNTFESRIPGTVGVGVGVEVSIRDDSGGLNCLKRCCLGLIILFMSGKETKRGEIGEVCVRGSNVTKGRSRSPCLAVYSVNKGTRILEQ
jgi:acyl-CoA synthetase (AMP-forming)/AMP-acid ligase II